MKIERQSVRELSGKELDHVAGGGIYGGGTTPGWWNLPPKPPIKP